MSSQAELEIQKGRRLPGGPSEFDCFVAAHRLQSSTVGPPNMLDRKGRAHRVGVVGPGRTRGSPSGGATRLKGYQAEWLIGLKSVAHRVSAYGVERAQRTAAEKFSAAFRRPRAQGPRQMI